MTSVVQLNDALWHLQHVKVIMIDANIDILEQDIEARINSFKIYRDANKRKTHIYVMSTAMLSSATTVLLGLSQYFKDYTEVISAIALLISGSLTVLSAWDGLYNHKKLWTSYTSALVQLYDLKADIVHLKSSNQIDQSLINQTYARYKLILGEINDSWIKLRTESSIDLKVTK